ncbi:hypothetical protein CCP3SC15_3910001 [Gammaproteobacteria bacterium]
MSVPAVYTFPVTKQTVRVIHQDGEPWFVANDVCAVLGIKNATQAVDRLDEDERSMFNIGRQGDANIISESGLYTLVLRSDKPEAKPFRKWVTAGPSNHPQNRIVLNRRRCSKANRVNLGSYRYCPSIR